ncbi:MAG: YicC family protein [Clostridia bacterium]|nr:YicC family protein [Clostridia bacterium]MBQ6858838.1 YicC family protein [Clostridia bacterium]MBQ7052141.1 YicC family protein [Clostridia bacterium]
MTGYGRCHIEEDGREITVEVKSVNHRFLDISYRLSRTLSFLDDAVRKGVGARLSRGHVDVFVSYANHRQDAREVRVDTGLALAYQKAVSELSAALGRENTLPLSDFTRLPDVLTVQEKEEDQQTVRELFLRALTGALDDLVQMREQEGERMRCDILEKIGNIESLRERIAERAPLVVTEYRDKLHQRIASLTEGEIDEARLITEVAIFADRAAIDEELVRLLSHTTAIRSTVEMTEPVGRKLDFLVQELNREVNTIGSKASDTMIAQAVVAAKGEIEKLREQVQNIE